MDRESPARRRGFRFCEVALSRDAPLRASQADAFAFFAPAAATAADELLMAGDVQVGVHGIRDGPSGMIRTSRV
jgi:hypothetical protein